MATPRRPACHRLRRVLAAAAALMAVLASTAAALALDLGEFVTGTLHAGITDSIVYTVTLPSTPELVRRPARALTLAKASSLALTPAVAQPTRVRMARCTLRWRRVPCRASLCRQPLERRPQ